jgi:hypothetical protein
VIPNVGELWELTETHLVTVGRQAASFLLSAPALVVAECPPNGEPGSRGGFYEVLWAGEIRAIPFAELPWIRFGARLG